MMSEMTGHAPNESIRKGAVTKRPFSQSRGKPFSLPSHFLVIDWGSSQAEVSVYLKKNKDFIREESFSLSWTDSESNPASMLGEQLSKELTARKITVQDVIVSVPRRFVVVKDVRLPQAILENDLAEVVRLQCEKIFPVNLSTLSVDFIVSNAPNSDNELSVLVAAIPKEIIAKISDTLHVARLKTVAMGITDLGIAKLVTAPGVETWQLHVLSGSSRIDFVLVYNQFPVISYGNDKPKSIPEKLGFISSSIDRILHSATQQGLDISKLSIHIHGMVEDSIREELSKRSPHEFVFHQTYTEEEIRDRALIAAYKTQAGAINFNSPRKPIDTIARNRNRSLALAAMVLIACGILSIPPLLSIEKLDRQLVDSQNTRKSLQDRLDRIQSIENTWKQIVAFERSKFDVATEIRQLVERLKPAEQMYLANLEMQENLNSGTTIVRLKGRVKDRETFSALTDELLLATDKYRLQPPLLEPVAGDDLYAFSFTFELELKS